MKRTGPLTPQARRRGADRVASVDALRGFTTRFDPTVGVAQRPHACESAFTVLKLAAGEWIRTTVSCSSQTRSAD
jgi:hypothetical protein